MHTGVSKSEKSESSRGKSPIRSETTKLICFNGEERNKFYLEGDEPIDFFKDHSAEINRARLENSMNPLHLGSQATQAGESRLENFEDGIIYPGQSGNFEDYEHMTTPMEGIFVQ